MPVHRHETGFAANGFCSLRYRPVSKIIDVFVCKLRKKLAKAGADGIIGTIWGRGYMIREPAVAESFAAVNEPLRVSRMAPV